MSAITEAESGAVVSVSFSSDTPDGHGSKNTKLILNGHDITGGVRSFALRSEVGSVTTAAIEVLPMNGFELNVPAALELTVVAIPGYVLIEEQTENGKRWRVEREK